MGLDVTQAYLKEGIRVHEPIFCFLVEQHFTTMAEYIIIAFLATALAAIAISFWHQKDRG